MSRQWQYFAAPKTENDTVTHEESPWLQGRMARIPREDWLLILEFGAQIDPKTAAALLTNSYSLEVPSGIAKIQLSSREIDTWITFLEDISARLLHSASLIPHPSETYPEDYTNLELSNMVRAVIFILKESQRADQPLHAWVE